MGLIIVFSQLLKFLGAPKGIEWFAAISSPCTWQQFSLLVGGATGAVMLLTPSISQVQVAALAGLLIVIGVRMID